MSFFFIALVWKYPCRFWNYLSVKTKSDHHPHWPVINSYLYWTSNKTSIIVQTKQGKDKQTESFNSKAKWGLILSSFQFVPGDKNILLLAHLPDFPCLNKYQQTHSVKGSQIMTVISSLLEISESLSLTNTRHSVFQSFKIVEIVNHNQLVFKDFTKYCQLFIKYE